MVKKCPNCSTMVLPMEDGMCPSCRHISSPGDWDMAPGREQVASPQSRDRAPQDRKQSKFMFLYFSYEGRVNRAKYWLFNVLLLAPWPIVGFVIDLLRDPYRDGPGIFAYLFWLLVFAPSLAMNVKRCHDRSRSGFFLLLMCVPLVNLWVLVELLLLPGRSGPNDWGDDPRKPLL